MELDQVYEIREEGTIFFFGAITMLAAELVHSLN